MTEHWAVPRGLNADEQRAWFELQAWQREFVARSRPRHVRWGGRSSDMGRRAGWGVAAAGLDLPGASVDRLQRSLLAVTAAIADPAVDERVRAEHRRLLGHEPTAATIGALELHVLDRLATRGALGRTVASAGAGGVTGSLAAGVGVAGAATGGLAAGAAVAAMALAAVADATFVVLQASRTTARTAAVYGFDPRDPDEQAAVLAVVGAALARRRDRAAALGRSHHLAALIAGRVTHGAAASDAARVLTRQLHTGLVLSLSGRQAGRGVPMLGAALSSGASVRTSRHVEEVARQLYRDRFLRRRSTLEQLTAGQFGQVGTGPTQSVAAMRS